MLKVRYVTELGVRWSIDGGDISFWYDAWFPEGLLADLCLVKGPPDRKVSWFLEDDQWFIERLIQVIPLNLVELIVNVPIALGKNDGLILLPASNGLFSSKLAWEHIRNRAPETTILKGCWSKFIMPTISIFC